MCVWYDIFYRDVQSRYRHQYRFIAVKIDVVCQAESVGYAAICRGRSGNFSLGSYGAQERS